MSIILGGFERFLNCMPIYPARMKIFRLLFFTSLLVFIFSLKSFAANLILNGQNEAGYARGERSDQVGEDSWGYFENYLELNANIEKFRLYLRQSYRLPSEFDVRKAGLDAIDKKYIEYRERNFTIHGGDFYRTWGNGLLFGNVEFLDLNIDTGIEGLLAEGYYKNLEAAAFRGVEIDTTGEFVEAAEGGYVAYSFPSGIFGLHDKLGLRLGGSYVRLDDGPRHPVINREGYEAGLDIGTVNLYGVYTQDRAQYDDVEYYHGFYSSLSAYGYGFGLLFEYKNYELFNYFDTPALQYPPTGIPESTMHLLDRHYNTIHFYDDAGYQLQLDYSLDFWYFSLNFNQSSKHDGDSPLPVFKEQFSPYQAALFRIERDPFDGDYYKLSFGWQEDVNFTATTQAQSRSGSIYSADSHTRGFSDWANRCAFGGLYEWRMTDVYALTSEFEVMYSKEEKTEREYWDEYLSLALVKSPEASFTVTFERSEDVRETGGVDWETGFIGGAGKYWASGEVTWNFLQRHQARVFYGYERGGLRCSGGSCRWVNPFKGVKIILTSQF